MILNYSYTILVLFIVINTSWTYAGVCEQLSNPKEIIDCVLVTHPDMRAARAGLEAANSLEAVAKQRVNPEVNSQTVWAKTYGNPYFYTEYNFAHTFELGGKRDARINKAKAEFHREKASNLAAKEKVYLETLVTLFRLRQLKSEISTINDALDTFTKIQRQYKSRPRLTPEQQATLRLFELAEGDYKMRLVPLESEKHAHLAYLEIALGKEFIPNGAALPSIRKSWPALPVLNGQDLKGSKIELAMADLKVSSSEITLASSSAWPDLKIGPTFELQNSIGQNFSAYGLNFTLPLPLYHRNEAGQAFANLETKRSEIKLEASRKESIEERTHYSLQYQRAVGSLQASMTFEDMNRRHEEVEKLFVQGLIPGNLVIELHRQLHDFTKTYNTQELSAVESLVRLNMLAGSSLEEMVW